MKAAWRPLIGIGRLYQRQQRHLVAGGGCLHRRIISAIVECLGQCDRIAGLVKPQEFIEGNNLYSSSQLRPRPSAQKARQTVGRQEWIDYFSSAVLEKPAKDGKSTEAHIPKRQKANKPLKIKGKTSSNRQA